MRIIAILAIALISIETIQCYPTMTNSANLEALYNALPRDLINQIQNVGIQMAAILTPAQIQLLEQQALQLGQNILNGNIDVPTAVNQILRQAQQYLGVNSAILSNIQPLVHQLVNTIIAILPKLSVNAQTRGLNLNNIDLSALVNQFQLSNLQALYNKIPQDLINQIFSIATQLAALFSPSQLQSIQQQAMQLAQNIVNGNMDLNTAVNQILQQAQQYLGANSPLLDNVKPVIQQLINTIVTVLPKLS